MPNTLAVPPWPAGTPLSTYTSSHVWVSNAVKSSGRNASGRRDFSKADAYVVAVLVRVPDWKAVTGSAVDTVRTSLVSNGELDALVTCVRGHGSPLGKLPMVEVVENQSEGALQELVLLPVQV